MTKTTFSCYDYTHVKILFFGTWIGTKMSLFHSHFFSEMLYGDKLCKLVMGFVLARNDRTSGYIILLEIPKDNKIKLATY